MTKTDLEQINHLLKTEIDLLRERNALLTQQNEQQAAALSLAREEAQTWRTQAAQTAELYRKAEQLWPQLEQWEIAQAETRMKLAGAIYLAHVALTALRILQFYLQQKKYLQDLFISGDWRESAQQRNTAKETYQAAQAAYERLQPGP